MKKPILSIKSYADAARLVFAVILCAFTTLLFFMPEESIPVFAGGAHRGISGIFNIVNGWV